MATQRNTNLIPAYKFKPILDLALPKDGDEGYNPETKTFIPFEAGDDSTHSGYEYFDSITAATEAGLADEDTWPMQFFASRDVFDEFLETLAAYEECYRITDRW